MNIYYSKIRGGNYIKERLSEGSADVFPVSSPMSILHFILEVQIPQPLPPHMLRNRRPGGADVLNSIVKENPSRTVTALQRFGSHLALGMNRTQTIVFVFRFFLIGNELLQWILKKWTGAHRAQL